METETMQNGIAVDYETNNIEKENSEKLIETTLMGDDDIQKVMGTQTLQKGKSVETETNALETETSEKLKEITKLGEDETRNVLETQTLQKGKAIETEINTLEKEEKEKMKEATLIGDDKSENGKQIPSIVITKSDQGFYEEGEPGFFKKLRKIVEDPETDSIISWSVTKESVMIWDNCEFCAKILPRFFKHNNLSSFIRQLNKYGFRKMNREKNVSEYYLEEFQGGQECLVNPIKNRYIYGGCSNDIKPNLDIDQSNLQAKIEKMKRYTNTMKVEIMELKQQQESIRNYLASMKKRIENNNEHKNEQIRMLLEKEVGNGAFFGQFTELVREKRELTSGQIAKKPRLEDPQSTDNLGIINPGENGEIIDEEEVTAIKLKEKEIISDLVVYEGAPSKDLKEEAVEWEDPDLYSSGYMLWNKMHLDEINNENEARAQAEFANYWQEEFIFVDRKF